MQTRETPLILTCDGCGRKLKVPDEWAGRLSSCPACQAPLEIPVDGEEIAELGDVEVKDDDVSPGVYNLDSQDAQLPDAKHTQRAAFGALGMVRLGRQVEPARCLALHADHKLGLAGCGEDVHVLDLNAGKRAFRFGKQKAWVSCLAIAPDGRRVLSGDREGGLVLWDLASKQIVRWLEGHSRAVNSVAFAPNGLFAASGGDDGVTRLWELETGKEYEFFEARWNGPVNSVAFSADGRQVLGAGSRVCTWSIKSGEPLVQFESRGEMTSAAFSRLGSDIAACTPASHSQSGLRVQRWDAATGRPLRCFENPDRNGVSVGLAVVVPGSLRILSMGKKMARRDPAGGMSVGGALAASIIGTVALNVLLIPTDYVGYVVFKPGESTFDPTDPYCMQVWALRSGSVQPFDAGKVAPTALAVSPDGARALSAGQDGAVHVWSLPL
jgi:WD40 repeat protein